MTTAYTKIIEEQGAVTLAQFVMRCARGMMPLVSIRDVDLDEPIPPKLITSRYYAERVEQCETALAQLTSITDQEAAALLDTRYTDHVATVERYNNGRATLQANCELLLAEVETWVPPTRDHTSLKKFMIEQLDDEIEHAKLRLSAPVKQSPAQWLVEVIADARDELELAKRDLAGEQRRTDGNNQWLDDLRESVGVTSPYRTAADPVTTTE